MWKNYPQKYKSFLEIGLILVPIEIGFLPTNSDQNWSVHSLQYEQCFIEGVL